MASKHEMTLEMIKVFDGFSWSFEELGVSRTDFTAWIDVQPYDNLRSSYRFLNNRLLKRLIIIKRILKYFQKDVWPAMKQFNQQFPEVLMLKEEVKEVKAIWRGRPRYKRRRGE